MTPFRNNLKKDDPVFDVLTKRPGKVAMAPRESSTRVSVAFQGNNTARYVDVMQLRLVIDGKPEDVAPVDGEPPAPTPRPERGPTAPHPLTAIDALKAERDQMATEMTGMNARFKLLKDAKERLDRAIAMLEAPV